MLNPEMNDRESHLNGIVFRTKEPLELLKQAALTEQENKDRNMEKYIARISEKLLKSGNWADLKRLPLGIEEFLYKAHFEERRLKNDETRADKFNNTEIFYAGPEDAGEIISLHNEIYDGHYPYREILDFDYVKQALNKETTDECDSVKLIAGLFKLKADPPDKIAGCAMLQYFPKKRKGYMRGLVIRPQYRTKIDIKKIFISELQKHFYDFKDKLDMWYSEGRTSHSIGQFMMHYTGSVTCAIFPNKDDFFGTGKRETDAMMVAYYLSAFEKRRKNSQILLEFKKLYRVMQKRFDLEDPHIVIPNITGINKTIQDSIEKARIFKDHAEIIKSEDKFGYRYYTITLPTGAYLSFTLNTIVMSAEGFKAHYNTMTEFISLFLTLKRIGDEDNIEYMEYYLPTNDACYQKILLDLGFSVFGYVPAWHENDDGSLSDCVIFGISKTPLDPKELDLTGSSMEIFRCVKPFLNLKKRVSKQEKTKAELAIESS